MIKAKITKQDGYKCRPPEAMGVITIPHGSVVGGQVAEWALADKAASRMFDPVQERKVEAQPETKATRKRKK